MSPAWSALLAARLGDNDVWQRFDPLEIKKLLDRLFPIAGASLSEVVKGNAVIAKLGDPARFELAASQHVHDLLEHRPKDWCCASFDPAPARIDLLDLLDARSDESLVRQAHFAGHVQGRYEDALSLLDTYAAELDGEPHASLERTASGWSLVNSGMLEGQEAQIRRFHDAARTAAYYAQGQTQVSSQALWYLAQPPADPAMETIGAFGSDYPLREFWSAPPTVVAEQMEFSSDNADPLKNALQFGPPADRAQLLAGIMGRFEGNPVATGLRYDTDAADPAVIRAAIARDADNWPLYKALTRVLIRQGAYAEASRATLAFPELRNPAATHDRVQLSNRAYQIGGQLYFKGAYEEARPLLHIAAGLDTGSGASERSAAYLALLDGKYREAALRFLGTARHYDDMDAYVQYLALLFAGGESNAAWSGFNQLTEQFSSHELWLAAMVGHRRDNLGGEDLASWLRARNARRAAPGDHALVDYGLAEFMTDRPSPPEKLNELIAQLAPPPAARFQPSGGADRQQYFGAGYYGPAEPNQRDMRLGPSGLKPPAATTTLGAEAPSIYPLLADAYLALRQERYPQASALFEQIASYYSIESDEDASGNFGYVLPYFAFAAAKSGDTPGLEKFLATLPADARNFHVLLGQATFHALRGEHDAALHDLDAALRSDVGNAGPVTPAYAYAETCVRLFEATGEPRYRLRALDWARRYRRTQPFTAWAHALVARYGDGDERIPALAAALYLDPRSQWAAETPAQLGNRAQAWLKTHHLFSLEGEPAGQHI
jgi:hypothetical protein